ncbi:MAG: secondary thiamine-phosphate synthase enzyme YjbQ [Parasphingopyxis sp.]|uniref:secondary thiamine-phosphate synthase enzyme YjbQ n=1 Tax=Parasphingopyxis sp. TaxID=1920299 RepID=UPI002630CDAB|nr:secondary thiamine-phosphate synthase enzyme YjbQ [uncultured Parasphingopyxis sp.]
MSTHRTTILRIETQGPSLNEFTGKAVAWVADSGVSTGLLTLFIRHTSASLLIQENAAPEVQDDLLDHFDRLAPEGPHYAHDSEGPDDMPAHLKAAMTQTHLAIPVIEGQLALGTWQGIYLFEHRRRPHHREVAMHLAGA